MSRIEFQARLRGGERVGGAAGFDRVLRYHFLTIDGQYSNLDQGEDHAERMGLNLLRLQRVLTATLRPESWPGLLLHDLDALWRTSLGMTRWTWPCQPFGLQPYLLVFYPGQAYTLDLLQPEHLQPGRGDYLNSLVQMRLAGLTDRVHADMLHPDSPARGYLTWCRDDARMLEPNPRGRAALGLEYELGGPLAVAMHVDDDYDPELFGASEVET